MPHANQKLIFLQQKKILEDIGRNQINVNARDPSVTIASNASVASTAISFEDLGSSHCNRLIEAANAGDNGNSG
jgi:hypothetical protein